ncbi:MAG TPA: PLP-dependent aminotransferase family protein [Candidatus Mediterraneibacter stercoravium]|uniref:PLP-dependent aminotransferase family protein n=1 Tax=Candidatus Mediterraneibacter stercoravium TaxID=2838685 RepID=A0A9D2GC55_9FIRM|nr:PLP-dependent aminotransferase family protein [Candidatus Mediterraneibacter stercoravium]
MYELTINLQPGTKVPLYEQIYNYIKQDIQAGRMKSGERLPSTRALCRHLEVSRSTVELAYEQLLSEGYVEAEPCRGYFVAQIEGLYQFDRKENCRKPENVRREKKYRYDFSPFGVDLKSFPYNAWRRLSRECLTDDRTELFRLGDPQGEYGLRSAICSYLHQARGVNCRPDQVIVGAGSDYLRMLLIMIIGNHHRVALENPTYRQAYLMFENLECEVCTVDMDSRGMSVEKLRESRSDIAFVMPSHQYPLGIVMPIRRRMELLKWADEAPGRYIIEDDYDSEFRYKGKPIPALQGYDTHGKVIYMGTFSKSIAPAIRMSYMVLPDSVLEKYRERCGFISSTVSRVDQLILQKFIEEGYYERHLNKTRALYKSRHDTLLGCLKEIRGDFEISGENAGVHLLLRFYGGYSEEELIRRAAGKDVKVYGLSGYYVGEQKMPEKDGAVILLGYANMSEDRIREAAALLEEAWRNK